MIFKYRVNYNGTYYEAGQDVPIEGEKNRGRQNAPDFSATENIKPDIHGNAHRYTLDELENMTVREIRSAASELGFEIKKTARDDVVSEFMEKQG